MNHVAMDVHKNESQIAIVTAEGELIEKHIRTKRSRLQAGLGVRSPARILIEASTENEWVARCLEKLSHGVIVGDPNSTPMDGQPTRRVKTDLRAELAVEVRITCSFPSPASAGLFRTRSFIPPGEAADLQTELPAVGNPV